MALLNFIKQTWQRLTHSVAVTAGYRNVIDAGNWANYQERPPFSLFSIEEMELDPKIQIALGVRNGLLLQCEVIVEGGPPKICDYVRKQWGNIWRAAGPRIVNTKNTGYAGFEFMYQAEPGTGYLDFKDYRDFNPRDIRPLIRNGRAMGLTVNGIRGVTNDPAATRDWTQFNSQGGRIPIFEPKALWLTYGTKFGDFFGRSCLRSAYPPWYEKWMKGGAVKLRNLRMLKDAYIGDVLWYPNRYIMQPDGSQISGRDLSDQIVSNRVSGSALSMPSTTDQHGNKEWDYKPPTGMEGSSQVFDYVDHLDQAILDALQTPSEVIKAVEGGIGGVGGRSVPLIALFATLQMEIADYATQINRQVLENMVRVSFATEPAYTIRVKPLMETMAKVLGGGNNSPTGDADNDGIPNNQDKQPFGPGSGSGSGSGSNMLNGGRSFGASQDRATEKQGSQLSEGNSPLAYKRAERNSPLKAGRCGAIVGGVYYKPGEWVEPKALLWASDAEVLRLSEDAQGHEHKGAGPGGGQFTSQGGGGSRQERNDQTDRDYAQKVVQAAKQKLKSGGTVHVMTRTKATPLQSQHSEMLRANGRTVQMQNKSKWEAISGETLAHLAGQVGLVHPGYELEPEDSPEVASAKKSAADAEQERYEKVVKDKFGGSFGDAIDAAEKSGFSDDIAGWMDSLEAKADRIPESEDGGRQQNFEQYLKENKIADPGADHASYGPSGKVSARSDKAMKDRKGEQFQAYGKAQADFQKMIDSGEVVDPTGKFKKQEQKPVGKEDQDKAARLRTKAEDLRRMARMGMKPKAFVKEAERLESEAEKLHPQGAQLSEDASGHEHKGAGPGGGQFTSQGGGGNFNLREHVMRRNSEGVSNAKILDEVKAMFPGTSRKDLKPHFREILDREEKKQNDADIAQEKSIVQGFKDSHDALMKLGAVQDAESESGSRYYTLPGGKKIRVADHAPNEATQAWLDNNESHSIRVDRNWKSQLEQLMYDTKDED